MGFSASRLFQVLQQLSSYRNYRIAYSGGLDSHVLLYGLVQLRLQFPEIALSAVHVDHGLNPCSEQWAHRCREACAVFEIDCEVIKVNARPAKGESPEAAAREARYSVLRERIRAGEYLLTAQHRDDQAETVLLQLLRGSGPHGLAAMAKVTAFGGGHLLRPLLTFSRAELKIYAEQERLVWIDDPSNQDISFDRNYLRHAVLPLLRHRWPGLSQTLSRAALHQVDAAWLLDQQAHKELDKISDGEHGLSVRALQKLAPPQRRNLLRYWLKQQELPLPDSTHLQRILDEVLPASESAQPLVAWPGAEVRRYRNRLYAQQPLLPHDPAMVLAWDGVKPLALPSGVGGVLVSRLTQGCGLDAKRLQQSLITVCFRRGGERIHLVDHSHGCTLKKLFQEQGIPPWQRIRIPMIYVDDKLAFVAGIGVAQQFAAEPKKKGVVIEWVL
jgi:tRNA(Ile)-lysidine synthase